MKVLIINTVCGEGSTGKICTSLADKIVSTGNECIIAYGRGKNKSNIDSIKISNRLSILYNALNTRLTDRICEGSKITTKKFIKKLEIIKPDIIHLHNLHGYYLNSKLLFEYIRKNEIPIIWTFHDCWPFTGHCVHFEYNNCYKWKTECYKCNHYGTYPKSFHDGSQRNFILKKEIFTGLSNVNIIAPSNWMKKYIEDSFLNTYKVDRIYNGIDMSKFVIKDTNKCRKLLNISSEKRVIVGVAKPFTKNKGFYDFIKLATLLNDYLFIMVGLTKSQLKEIPSNVIGILKTSNVDDLVNIYNCGDVFINLTYEDNLPTVNLEAQACGIPVLCYNTGGCIETLNKKFSKIVDVGDFDQLESCISKMSNIEVNEKLELSNWVKTEFVDSKMSEEYLKLYKSVLMKRS